MNMVQFASKRIDECQRAMQAKHMRKDGRTHEVQRDEYDGTIRRFRIMPNWEDACGHLCNIHSTRLRENNRPKWRKKMLAALYELQMQADEVRDAEHAAGWDANP